MKLYFKKKKIDGKFFMNRRTGQLTYVISKKKLPKGFIEKIPRSIWKRRKK